MDQFLTQFGDTPSVTATLSYGTNTAFGNPANNAITGNGTYDPSTANYNLFLKWISRSLPFRQTAMAPTMAIPGSPGGIFRIGYGINGTINGIGVSDTETDGQGNTILQDSFGDFQVDGNGGCVEGEGPCTLQFTLLDADFEPLSNSTPEPTTLLLLNPDRCSSLAGSVLVLPVQTSFILRKTAAPGRCFVFFP